ncbi:hypothetical protein HRbin10_00691 [bacterium HR10]|nr:hypothetical protein HRbin10_00691 [bacterium HR10]
MKTWHSLVIAGFIGLGLLLGGGAMAFLRYTEGGVEELLRDPRYTNDRTERLIVMLDGVPYETMDALWQQGYFRIFPRPSRVIAPFPSMTDVSAAEIWGAEPPEGYESLYFDRAGNALRGGAGTYLRKRALRNADYHRKLDYVEPRAYEFAAYGFPERIFRADLRRFLLAYTACRRPVFTAFLKSTDAVAHIGGEELLKKALVQLDMVLRAIARARAGRLEITLFSEHGNQWIRPRRADVNGHLRRHGFRVRDRLDARDERAVVIPDFGLVGYMALYAMPSARRRVAEALAEMEEVALVAYADGEDVVVLGGGGVARISYDRRRGRFRYEAQRGDPLGLKRIAEQMTRRGEMPEDGYIADAVWFKALAAHSYPDALFRLYHGVHGLVKNRADVLVSFRDGFVSGRRAFQAYDRLIPIVAIHGGIGAAQSVGFFMSTAGEAPPYLRAEMVRAYLERR